MKVSYTLIIEFMNTITNILLFSTIPLVWYLTRERTFKGFIHSLGIYKSQIINPLAVLANITIVYVITLVANIMVIISANSGRSSVDTNGFNTITLFLYLLLYGMKTAIAEEILFRGFIAKKLIKKLGYSKGNVVEVRKVVTLKYPLKSNKLLCFKGGKGSVVKMGYYIK